MSRHYLTLRERFESRNRLAIFGVAATVVFVLGWLLTLILAPSSITAEVPAGSLAGVTPSQPIPRPSDRDDAAWRAAQRTLDGHRAALDQWLDNHLRQWVYEVSSLPDDRGTSPEPGTSPPDHEQAFKTNPQWGKLSDQLRGLQQRRADYLERYTQEHPDLKKLEYDIQDLQHILNNTPQFSSTEDSAPQPTNSVAQRRTTDLFNQERITAERMAELQTYERLKSATLGAQQTLDSLKDDQLAEARQRWNDAVDLAEQLSRESTAPSRGQPRSIPWPLLVLLAIIGGGAAAAVSPASKDAPLQTVAEIQQILQLPVIGTFPLQCSDLEMRIGA